MRIIGVDIGGTFTDVYYVDNDADEQLIHKVSTTPDDPSKGALTGIQEMCELASVDPGTIDYVLHATTIATNAVLEHEGAKTGMITTENYRDVVHIGRHQRPQNYSIQQDIPWQENPLVKRRNRKTVPERLSPDGKVETPLDESAVREAARELRDAGVESVSVCFLYSYLSDEHEQRAKEIVGEELPDAYVTTSSEVYPQFREFERFTTTAMNSAIGPPVSEYINRFEDKLESIGVQADLHIMQSNGGIATVRTVTDTAVTLLLSGPAAGVLGGKWRADTTVESGAETNAITLDMGGTSADIGLISNGEIVEANVRETEIGGYPVMIPMTDIETIGAGGGSIAYIDKGGALRVGPKSAGAMPGPVAYDRGGMEPTVTDAHVALGRIREEFFLGGEMELAADDAADAIEERVAEPLGMDVIDASLGILDIVNSSMANAIRTKTIQKGRDPQKFTLTAFGGAGPMHAASVARDLNIPHVLIPASPGVLSAVGLTTTDLQYDYINTKFETLGDANYDDLAGDYQELIQKATDQLKEDNVPESRVHLELTADCRYAGQGYELNLRVDEGTELATIETITDRFHTLHESEFGHNFSDNEIELVNERVTAYGDIPSSNLIELPTADDPVDDHVLYEEDVYFSFDGITNAYQTPFVDRTSLKAGHEVAGPAIIGDKDSTIIVPPDFNGTVSKYGDIELTQEGNYE